MSCQNHSLKPWNTFSLEASAAGICVADSVEALCRAWLQSQQRSEPVLLLGEGSNVLFLEDFQGQVIVNRIMGIEVTESSDAWHLHVGSGENWHALVQSTLRDGYPGLENLAMIPGCAGSAPIQNIGAYGVELEKVCEYVDIVRLADGSRQRLSAEECRFAYRDSVFKHQYREGYALIALGLRLNKIWQPVLTYGELRELDRDRVTPQQVFETVCRMRSSKLPDPAVTGNAGSFFKNPLVSAEMARQLKEQYDTIPLYPQENGEMKLAAGWLIDRCNLKGFRMGGAAVHQQQALVLINTGNATGQDVVALAREVRQRVGKKFNVWLEPEVRFISAQGETDAVEVIA
ncbi:MULTISPECIES: UDP-N-acetylmuramate dehydrogenase [unclassified Erwinia]|uniref:UDP-N-acetylmuramate dehydrogenase n=1 Tax=unclassified Erwinia TaxID=2622719 RepID=UPI0006FF1F3B|nr:MULTISPECIES: UDP-N-acetylmuramate dehydrogenase [unclassified Erwinia]KQN57424.1 UDP-N-acetylenolpyruvoylglucosamine reductase [Erwinia sp. Leaf53]PLV46061.1 UDP-N-acetylenolpyruvoylglucosamine reductase [Erwinia sp. B116]